MTAYLIRRLGTSVVIVIGISVFIFVLLHVIYPSPAIDVLGPRANTVLLDAWNREHGFDDPVIVGRDDNMLLCLDPRTMVARREFVGHSAPVYAVAVSLPRASLRLVTRPWMSWDAVAAAT